MPHKQIDHTVFRTKAIRYVTHAQPRDQTDFYKSLNLIKVSVIMNLNMATFVYRSCLLHDTPLFQSFFYYKMYFS